MDLSVNIENELDVNSYDNKEIINLKNKISSLSKNEFIEIFKIIKENNNKYTENKNGIFINMSKLTQNTIVKLENFVNYTLQNRDNLESDSILRENIKDIIEKEIKVFDNNNSIQSSIDNINMNDNGNKNNNTELDSFLSNNDLKEEIIYDYTSDSISFDISNNNDLELNEFQKDISGINNKPINKNKLFDKKKKNNKNIN